MSATVNKLIIILLIVGLCLTTTITSYASSPENYDHKELCRFLNLSEEQFMKQWKKHKSIATIAWEQGISESELFQYFHETFGWDWLDTTAYVHEQLEPLEKTLSRLGYQSVERAVKAIEQNYGKTLRLPIKLPPLPFTLHMGKFIKADDVRNDKLELIFENPSSAEMHYEIWVRPVEHRIELNDFEIEKTYRLDDGTKAVYGSERLDGNNRLVFEMEDWQYTLWIDNRVTDIVTPDILIEIANSISY